MIGLWKISTTADPQTLDVFARLTLSRLASSFRMDADQACESSTFGGQPVQVGPFFCALDADAVKSANALAARLADTTQATCDNPVYVPFTSPFRRSAGLPAETVPASQPLFVRQGVSISTSSYVESS